MLRLTHHSVEVLGIFWLALILSSQGIWGYVAFYCWLKLDKTGQCALIFVLPAIALEPPKLFYHHQCAQ